jgi:type IV fimbrial biogenesis protein FimT
MNSQRGYTLHELLLGLAGLGILCGIALPSFGDGMAAVRAGEARNALLESLMLASSRAALTETRSVICPSSDGERCDSGPDWGGGWIVFGDHDGDRERSALEPRIHAEPALAAGVRLRSSVGRTRIVIQGNGGNAGSNVTFTLCDSRGPAEAVSLVLSNRGRLRDQPADADAAALACAP